MMRSEGAMKARLLAFAALLALFLPSAAMAQTSGGQWIQYRPTFNGTLSSGQFLGPAGTCAAPTYGWTDDNDGTGSGWYRQAANTYGFCNNGTETIRFANGGGVRLGPSFLSFGTAFADGLILTRESDAVLQMGIDVNGAAVDQTLKGPDGITGTDKSGGMVTVAGGRATGIASGGDVRVQTSPALTTGTTAQTLETRSRVVAKQFTVADNTATTFTVQTLGNDLHGGGTIQYCVIAQDATTAGIECGSIDYAGVDVTAGAGGEVCPNPTKVGTPLQALSGSTLAVTFTATTGTDLCNLKVTADTDIATPTALYIKYSITQNSGRSMTAQ